MGLVDELVAAVEGAGGAGAEAGKKEVVVGFLKEAGPVVEGLGAEAFRAVMGELAGGNGVPEEVVGALDEGQVVGELGEVDGAMDGEIVEHAAAVKARAELVEMLKEVAIGVVARVVVGMI